MKAVCFIGARAGSKGVPNKNSRNFAGKPLISYAIQDAIKSKLFKHVVVSTDSEKIAKIAKKFGADVPFMRPKKLATDRAKMMDVITHCITKLRELDYEFDTFVSRDCTVPFIRNSDIKGALNKFKKNNCDAVFGVYKQHLNPYFNMVEPNKKGYLEISKKLKKQIIARQDAPIVYQLNGLFVFNPNSLLKYKTAFMPKVLPFEIPLETGLMIDTELEFKIGAFMQKEGLIKKLSSK